jgi:hypothetical protein
VLAAPGQTLEVGALLLGERAGEFQVEELGVADHRVDRRAELVAHRRQEAALRLVGRVRLPARRLGLGEQPLDLATGQHLRGHVGAVRDHPGHAVAARAARARAGGRRRVGVAAVLGLDQRHVGQVDVPLLGRRAGCALHEQRHLAPDERLARGEHAVEQLLEPWSRTSGSASKAGLPRMSRWPTSW